MKFRDIIKQHKKVMKRAGRKEKFKLLHIKDSYKEVLKKYKTGKFQRFNGKWNSTKFLKYIGWEKHK
jgi:hypothetical protein